MAEFNPYYEWLGIPPHEQPADYYRLLGLVRFESNATVISNAADRQISHLRMFQVGPRGQYALAMIQEIITAKACLLAPDQKAEYDRLLSVQSAPSPPVSPPRPVTQLAETRLKKRVKRQPVSPAIFVLQIAGGGIVGVAAALFILKFGFKLDPLGVFPREVAQRRAGESDQSNRLRPVEARDVRSSPLPVTSRAETESFSPAVTPNRGRAGSQRRAGRRNASRANARNVPSNHVQPRATNDNQPDEDQTINSSAVPSGAGGNSNAELSESELPTDGEPQMPAPPTIAEVLEEPPKVDSRLPAPDDAAQQTARETVYTVYQDDYQQLLTLPLVQQFSRRADLARRMLRDANRENNDVNRYVLLDRAREIAVESGDPELTMQVIDEMATRYRIADFELREAAFAAWQVAIPRLFTAPSERKALQAKLAAMIESVAQQAFDEQQYATAEALFEKGQSLAKQAGVTKLANTLAKRARAAREESNIHSTIEPLVARLKENPEDPEAVLAVGRYYCLRRGEWSKGLALLAQSATEPFRSAATLDLDATNDPNQREAAAESWLKVAADLDEPEKRLARDRARFWYQQQLAAATGLAKAQIEKRLQEIEATSAAGGSQESTVDRAELDARFAEGIEALRSGKFKFAERVFRECLNSGGEQPGTLNNLAVAYALQRKLGPAFHGFRRAFETLNGSTTHPAGLRLSENLMQLSWGARHQSVSSVSSAEFEAVMVLARQYADSKTPSNQWSVFSNPEGLGQEQVVAIAYVCLHCEGKEQVNCVVDRCRNGKLLQYKTVDEGGGIVQTIPTNVRCRNCNGTGKVSCPTCRME